MRDEEVATVGDVRDCLVASGFSAGVEKLPNAPRFVEDRAVDGHRNGDVVLIAPVGDVIAARQLTKELAGTPNMTINLTEDRKTVVLVNQNANDATLDDAERCAPSAEVTEVGCVTVELAPGESVCRTYSEPGTETFAPHNTVLTATGLDCAEAEAVAEALMNGEGPPDGWVCGASGIACEKDGQSFRVVQPDPPKCAPGYRPSGPARRSRRHEPPKAVLTPGGRRASRRGSPRSLPGNRCDRRR